MNMESYKAHNKSNKCEERYNTIKNCDASWQWEYNSVVLFGGYWDYTSYSGSRCSFWSDSPSDSDDDASTRYICRGVRQ
jgi:hypothetical protein